MEWCSAETNPNMFDISELKFKAFLKPVRVNVGIEHEELNDVQSQVNNILNFLNSEEEVNNDASAEYEPATVIPEKELDVNPQKNGSQEVQIDSDRDDESEGLEEMEDFTEEEQDVPKKKKENFGSLISKKRVPVIKLPKISKEKLLEDYERSISKKSTAVEMYSKKTNSKTDFMEKDGDLNSCFSKDVRKESSSREDCTPVEEHLKKANSATDLNKKDGDSKSCSSEDNVQNDDVRVSDGSDYVESNKEDTKDESSKSKNETGNKAFYVPQKEGDVSGNKNDASRKLEDSDEEKEDVYEDEEKEDTGKEKEDADEEKNSERSILKLKITKKPKKSISEEKMMENCGNTISKKRVPVIKLTRISKEKLLEEYERSISKRSTAVEVYSKKIYSKTDFMEKDGDFKSCTSEDDLQNDDVSNSDGTEYVESDQEDMVDESSESKNVTSDKVFPCFLCDEKFSTKNKMLNHRRLHNFPLWPLSVGKGAICDECGKVIKSRSALASHKRMHVAEKMKCRVCKETFSEALHLRQHVCNEEQRVKHICELCGSTYSRRGDLNQHMLKVHDDKTYDCEQCGKSFNHPANLKLHLKIHKGEKSFICDICGKGFIFSGALGRHKRMHAGIKPFKCIRCGKFCSSRTNLNSHLLSHTNELSFRCDLCPKAYNHKTSLQLHVKNHHYDKSDM
ncbi:zinc finger protein 37-like [Saccostrea cucullata]|uniref:zinc finger protein 37-like n=1 Tax=Saccostrea cuccullata TaxID=36930 RepID=UPI002ED24030